MNNSQWTIVGIVAAAFVGLIAVVVFLPEIAPSEVPQQEVSSSSSLQSSSAMSSSSSSESSTSSTSSTAVSSSSVTASSVAVSSAGPSRPDDSYYNNAVAGYSVKVQGGAKAMGSNTFGVWESKCAVDGMLGPIDLRVFSRKEVQASTYYDAAHRAKLLLAPKERIEAMRQANLEPNPNLPNKTTGLSQELRINGKIAYRFQTTESVDSFDGGALHPGTNTVVTFDDGDLMFHLSYSASDEPQVESILNSWSTIPQLYGTSSLYDAAKKCQQALSE